MISEFCHSGIIQSRQNMKDHITMRMTGSFLRTVSVYFKVSLELVPLILESVIISYEKFCCSSGCLSLKSVSSTKTWELKFEHEDSFMTLATVVWENNITSRSTSFIAWELWKMLVRISPRGAWVKFILSKKTENVIDQNNYSSHETLILQLHLKLMKLWHAERH